MWYFDNVLAGQHGSPKSPFFLFSPSYWGITKKNRLHAVPNNVTFRLSTLTIKIREDLNVNKLEDIEAEIRRSADPHSAFPLKIQNVSKTYRSFACCASSKDNHAVSNLSMVAEGDAILCLLGFIYGEIF